MPDYRMKWIRIWPHAWFDSSMRVELTNAERAFWVDVIALAGKSRTPGVICSDPEGKVGYPLTMLSSMLVSWTPTEVDAIIEKLEKTQRVKVVRIPLLSGEDGWIVHIVNWKKYQSEAQRVQKYKKGYTQKVFPSTPNGCTNACTEVEEEVDIEEEGEEKKPTPSASLLPLLPSWLPVEEWKDFIEMRKKIKAPLTERAKKLVIGKLEDLMLRGEIVSEVLKQSIERSWRGVFPVPAKGNNEQQSSKSQQRSQRNAAVLAGMVADFRESHGPADRNLSRGDIATGNRQLSPSTERPVTQGTEAGVRHSSKESS